MYIYISPVLPKLFSTQRRPCLSKSRNCDDMINLYMYLSCPMDKFDCLTFC